MRTMFFNNLVHTYATLAATRYKVTVIDKDVKTHAPNTSVIIR